MSNELMTLDDSVMTLPEAALTLATFSMEIRRLKAAIRRCRATGLDTRSYAGLRTAGRSLSPSGFHVIGSWAKPLDDDGAFIDMIVSLEWCLAIQYGAVLGLTEVAEQTLEQGYELRRLGAHLAADAKIAEGEGALEVLARAESQLSGALGGLRAVYDQLEDTYQQVYDTIRAGIVLPYRGRWITGEDPGVFIPPALTRTVQRAARALTTPVKAR